MAMSHFRDKLYVSSVSKLETTKTLAMNMSKITTTFRAPQAIVGGPLDTVARATPSIHVLIGPGPLLAQVFSVFDNR